MAKGWNTSPWRFESGDFLNRRIWIEITFDIATLEIINPGLSGFRDVGCVYDRILVGRPGTEAPIREFLIPEGSFSVSRQTLRSQGFRTIQEVVDSNFTLGTPP